ncbi:MAG: four helix bundle protein [Gemmatimonadaceae bacterium]|nr:four helix bundle protein [Gemmatimonadaceae bacterium]
MQDFRKLLVWEKSHQLAMEIYRIAGRFPRADGLALTSQLRRSALSIPTNLAEGAGKLSDVEFRRFIQIALGSASECQYHLLVARELKLINEETYVQLRDRMAEVRRMLTGLSKKLSTTPSKPK